jgi:hypothetical protein
LIVEIAERPPTIDIFGGQAWDEAHSVPKMIAFEESGKMEILDPDLFNILLRYKEEQ